VSPHDLIHRLVGRQVGIFILHDIILVDHAVAYLVEAVC
jgi:hypothetical protein